MQKLSYHDVIVYIDGVKYCPSDNYALELTCNRVAGWRLWSGGKLLGGEFDHGAFCIEVAGMVIVGRLPANVTIPERFGWDGVVHTHVSPANAPLTDPKPEKPL